uniref:Uncharacterized protein n=1 Tax=Arundo donax TaxID=35708 RepID=A0A0A9AGZ6_ARUDO
MLTFLDGGSTAL